MLQELADRHPEEDAELFKGLYVDSRSCPVPEPVGGLRMNAGLLPEFVGRLDTRPLGDIADPPSDHKA